MRDPWPDSPYTVLVARAKNSNLCEVWPGYSQIGLPSVPIPLAKPDPDIILDLQPMIDRIYKRSALRAKHRLPQSAQAAAW